MVKYYLLGVRSTTNPTGSERCICHQQQFELECNINLSMMCSYVRMLTWEIGIPAGQGGVVLSMTRNVYPPEMLSDLRFASGMALALLNLIAGLRESQ